ncbi:amidohydrolase [Guggenheimella bovis]
MKTVFLNGKIYLERDRFQEAVLVEDSVIQCVGTTEDIKKLSDGANVIDLKGKTVLPGLIDTHLHLIFTGMGLSTVNISSCTSINDLVETCKRFIEEHPEAVKNGIHAGGWNQDLFTDEKRIPNRHDLDRISTEIPIVLDRVCIHICAANTKAIELLGLTGDSPQYEGGTFEIEDGYPNGIFKENSLPYIHSVIPKPTKEDVERMYLQAMEYCMNYGITCVHSNDIGEGPAKTDDVFKLVHKVYDEKKAKIRYHHQLRLEDPKEFKRYTETEFVSGDYSNPLLTLGPLKCIKDGSLGARTATMRKPYADDPGNYGVEAMSESIQRELLKIAKDNGIQVVTHVIGDRAVSDTVRLYKEFMTEGNPERFALVHCQITDKELLDEITKANIYVLTQPIFLDYDMAVVEDRVGKEMARTSYAFKTLIKGGSHVAFGTDSPVEDPDPWINIYTAVTRKNKKGLPEQGWNPEECVDIYDAIDSYTIEGARAMFKENELGRIKEGYCADLIVVDRDVFTIDPMDLRNVKPLLSMVNGEILFNNL